MLTRWDPFDEMERLTGRFFGGGERQQRMFAPMVDVFESDDNIELRAELPGLKPNEVEIDVTDNVLTLSGERKLEHDEEREGYRKIERSYGRFSRSFTLPRNVDTENIKAEMNEGVLSLTLPKREVQKARRIEVKAEKKLGEGEKEKGKKKDVEVRA